MTTLLCACSGEPAQHCSPAYWLHRCTEGSGGTDSEPDGVGSNTTATDGRVCGELHCRTTSRQVSQIIYSHFPIVSLSGVGRHYCISPGFSVLCDFGSSWCCLISPRTLSIHLSLSLPRGLFPPTFIVVTCFATFVSLFSSHGHTMKDVSGDICGDWLDHYIAAELFVSNSTFPCFALKSDYLFQHYVIYSFRIDTSLSSSSVPAVVIGGT